MRARISTQWAGTFVPSLGPRSLTREKPCSKKRGPRKNGEKFYFPWKNRDWLLKGRIVLKKTRHFINWRHCGEIFFLFSFFLALDTLSGKIILAINAAVKRTLVQSNPVDEQPRLLRDTFT